MLGAEGGFQEAGAAGLEACVGGALQFYILDAALFAELTLGRAAAFGIDHEDVRLNNIERGDEVDDTTALIDVGFLDGLDILDHKQAFFLWEHGLSVLILQIGGIGADAYIQVAIQRGLLEELYVAAVKKVVAAADEYFFIYHLL